MEKILVSACLAGEKTRYDGKDNASPDLIDNLAKYFDLVFCCPEVMGGLPTPRDPSEIRYTNQVVSSSGKDVTKNFVQGASEAVRLCQFFGIRYAVLKESSPSCGTNEIHDGSFSGRKIKGMGFTARRLQEAGITIYSETTVSSLLETLAKRDQTWEERDRIRTARMENEKKANERQDKKPEHPFKRDRFKPRNQDGEKRDRKFSDRPRSRFGKDGGPRKGDRPSRNGSSKFDKERPFKKSSFSAKKKTHNEN